MNKALGNNIRKYRNVNQLRQVDLAKMIGKSTRMLQKYEAGEVTPSLEVIELLAEKLGVDFYDLLKKHRKPSTTPEMNRKLKMTCEQLNQIATLAKDNEGLDIELLVEAMGLTVKEEEMKNEKSDQRCESEAGFSGSGNVR